MTEKKLITAEELRQLLHYDPETGVFTWVRRRPNIRVGNIAGYLHHIGYICIELNGRAYAAHRLAFLYMTGRWPYDQIDHRDMNKANNQWNNLREATDIENRFNRIVRSDNRSGYKGVGMRISKNGVVKYVANIGKDGKRKYLGFFDNKEAARQAYLNEVHKLHGEFANEG